MVEPGRPSVIALTTDVMLSVRIEEAVRTAGYDCATFGSADRFAEALSERRPGLVLVDLADPAFPVEETVKRIQEAEPRPALLGFFPHVRKDLEERARSAGCDLVLPRSRFLLDLPAALDRGIARLQEQESAADAPREMAP